MHRFVLISPKRSTPFGVLLLCSGCKASKNCNHQSVLLPTGRSECVIHFTLFHNGTMREYKLSHIFRMITVHAKTNCFSVLEQDAKYIISCRGRPYRTHLFDLRPGTTFLFEPEKLFLYSTCTKCNLPGCKIERKQ